MKQIVRPVRFPCLFALALRAALPLMAQEIVTAEYFLAQVGERYEEIRDYEARLTLQSGRTEMSGVLSYLAPNLLRIDFTSPKGQALVYNGETLTIYLPEQRAILSQTIASGGAGSANAGAVAGTGMATAQGLRLLRTRYTASFPDGPEPQPLSPGSRERVVKIALTRRANSESFHELTLYVTPGTQLIRRIEGTAFTGIRVVFDFTSIKTGVGIPAQRFVFDAPATANLYNNFLFHDNDE